MKDRNGVNDTRNAFVASICRTESAPVESEIESQDVAVKSHFVNGNGYLVVPTPLGLVINDKMGEGTCQLRIP